MIKDISCFLDTIDCNVLTLSQFFDLFIPIRIGVIEVRYRRCRILNRAIFKSSCIYLKQPQRNNPPNRIPVRIRIPVQPASQPLRVRRDIPPVMRVVVTMQIVKEPSLAVFLLVRLAQVIVAMPAGQASFAKLLQYSR